MAARSPWTLAALALVWLGCTSALAAEPLDMALLWLLGLGAGAYLARPARGSGIAPEPVPPASPTEVDPPQPQDPGPTTTPPALTTEAAPAAPRGPAGTPPSPTTAEPTSPSPPSTGAPLRTLTAEEVAAALRLDPADVIAAMVAGELPGNQVAGHWRCNENSLTTWLDGAWSPNRP